MSPRDLRAVILAPLDPEGQRVASAIRQGLEKAGFEVTQSMLPMGTSFAAPMLKTIAGADLVVVDLTSQSPSVYYELGFAHGRRKTTILVTSNESAASLPADLRGYLYLAYDRSDLTDLVEQVRREALVSSRAAMAAG